MAEGNLIKCPTCGSSLAPDGHQANIQCPYCGNTVMVPAEFRQADAGGAAGSSPLNIVVNDAGTTIQVSDLAALQRESMKMALGSGMAGPTSVNLPSAVNRWIKISIWAFVIIMVVSIVVPLLCSFLGIFAAFVPFFLH